MLAGAQDRLSWMVQLAARLQALPGELQLGQRIEMPVAGPNGMPPPEPGRGLFQSLQRLLATLLVMLLTFVVNRRWAFA